MKITWSCHTCPLQCRLPNQAAFHVCCSCTIISTVLLFVADAVLKKDWYYVKQSRSALLLPPLITCVASLVLPQPSSACPWLSSGERADLFGPEPAKPTKISQRWLDMFLLALPVAKTLHSHFWTDCTISMEKNPLQRLWEMNDIVWLYLLMESIQPNNVPGHCCLASVGQAC